MIGVFDSGAGGLTAITEIRKINPSVDVCFFADYKNAPYGTKSERELIRLVKDDVSRLLSAGAENILMACCTASTVHQYLPDGMKKITMPIIAPAAREAAHVTRLGRIGVIATAATVRSGRFSKELFRYGSVKDVFELPTQELVSLVECGASDSHISKRNRELLYNILKPIKSFGIDTLILGCTHFSHLEREIGSCLPGVKTVNASKIGAKEIIKRNFGYGKGKIVYL
jgi:glutamate racemase